jgi:hypothetical protein
MQLAGFYDSCGQVRPLLLIVVYVLLLFVCSE